MTACAHPAVQAKLTDELKAPCVSPSHDGVVTEGDLAAFSVRQEAVITSCEAKRSGLVQIIQAGNGKR